MQRLGALAGRVVRVRGPAAQACRVEIEGVWEEHAEAQAWPADALTVAHTPAGVEVELSPTATRLVARVPEQCTLDVLCAGDVRVRGKIEGDGSVALESTGGALAVDKVRGVSVRLVGAAGVRVEALAEAMDLTIAAAAGDVEVNRVQAGSLEARASGEAALGALYVRSAVVAAGGDARVGHAHGAIDVSSEGGGVSVASVDGCMQLRTIDGDVSAHVNSLTAGSASASQSANGDVHLTVSSTVAAVGVRGGAEEEEEFVLDGSSSESVAGGGGGGAFTSGKISPDGAKRAVEDAFYSPERKDGVATLAVVSARGQTSVRVLSWADSIRERFMGSQAL